MKSVHVFPPSCACLPGGQNRGWVSHIPNTSGSPVLAIVHQILIESPLCAGILEVGYISKQSHLIPAPCGNYLLAGGDR